MKITGIQNTILAVACVVISNAAFAAQAQRPMPPTFSFMYEPEKILHEYPLGLINEAEAFAHHGGPVRKLILPNGNHELEKHIGSIAIFIQIYSYHI